MELNWTLQTKTNNGETWVCRVGYVSNLAGRVTWGFWGNKIKPRRAPTVAKAKEALAEAYQPEYEKMLEKAITGTWGLCIKCQEEKLGTPQRDPGKVLCLRCQSAYRRDLRL